MHFGSAMVVIENHNGENHRRGDHEHYTVEIGSLGIHEEREVNGRDK